MKKGLLNPLYIEQYGLTYENPINFAGLQSIYGTRDTSDILMIDYDKMKLLGEYGMHWDLKYATREDFKPFYYSLPAMDNQKSSILRENILEMMDYRHTEFGVSIDRDCRVMASIADIAQSPAYNNLYRPISKKKHWFSFHADTRPDYLAMATGYWWGKMAADGFNF